jgi:hypothetical protein
MSDSPVLDGGARFPEVITVRLPPGFLDRIRAAAEGEGIAPRDFTRRAISERLLRLEAAGSAASQQPPTTASAAKTSSAGQPASAATAERRRDA